MKKCKAKQITDIQTYSGIGRDIQELFRHIQAYSETYVTQAYSEPWYIQNHRHTSWG